jgi:hypothetical protein
LSFYLFFAFALHGWGTVYKTAPASLINPRYRDKIQLPVLTNSEQPHHRVWVKKNKSPISGALLFYHFFSFTFHGYRHGKHFRAS